jgi:hypothetical protein
MLYAEEPENRFKPTLRGGDWRSTVLVHQRVGAAGLRMLTTLEKQPARQEATVRQVRPAIVWFEVQPTEGNDPFSLRWGSVPGYPAPTWGLSVPAWPVRQDTNSLPPPIIRAWWSAERPDPTARLGVRDILKARDHPVAVLAGDEKASVDSVRVEKRQVRKGPGFSAPIEEHWCLVVRVSHPAGRPFLPRLEGLPDPLGEEHRFYTRANKSVSIYWFAGVTTEDRMLDRLGELNGLQLLSVAALKTEASQLGHHVEFNRLSAPAATPPPPQPFLDTN